MPEMSPLEFTKSARDGLRRIRAAAVDGEISAEEMQRLSDETNRKLALALLQKNPNRLKPEDQFPIIPHVENLNKYLLTLLPDTQRLNLVGNPMDQGFVSMVSDVFGSARMIDKYKHTPDSEKPTLVALLSTGAVALSIFSYLYDIPVYVAAVNKNRNQVVVPALPADRDITVIDDVVGSQAKLVQSKIRDVFNGNIQITNLLGRKS